MAADGFHACNTVNFSAIVACRIQHVLEPSDTVTLAAVANCSIRRSVGAVLPGPQIINGGAGQLLGGGNQVYIPEVDANWFN